MLFMALLPVVVHFAFLGIAIIKNGYIPTGKVDLLFHIIIFIYVLVVLVTLKRRKLFIRILYISYLLIFVIIPVEAFFRIINSNLYFPWPPNIHRSGYVAKGAMPGINGKIEFSVNKYGLRGPPIDLNNVHFKILVLGGSASECLYIKDELSWPWRLQDKLSDRLKRRYFVGNAGKSGYTTLDNIITLLNYKFAPQFDLVIVLCGINDMGRLLRNYYVISSANTVYYKDSHLYLFVKNIFIKNKNDDKVYQDINGLWYINERKIRAKALKENPIRQKPVGLKNALLIYKSNLRKIISVCRIRNQDLLMLTQPTLYQNNLSKELDALLWEHVGGSAYTTEILEEIMLAYNQTLIEVCKEEGVPYIDIASILPKDKSVFYDDCHFNISGCEMVSEIVFEKVIKLYMGKHKAF